MNAPVEAGAGQIGSAVDVSPLVTVILPSYNHCRFVEQSIRSVTGQTYANIQLIVIDDGSTDGSVDVIRSLAEEFHFEFVEQRNAGLIETLNRAKRRIRGKYVALTASDDYWHPEKTARQVRYLEKHPGYALVHSRIRYVNEYSIELREIRERCTSGSVFPQLLLGEFHVHGLSALVRADIFSQFEYGRFYIDDLYMWLKIAERHPIGYLDEALAFYRRHDNHLTGNSEKMMLGEKEIIDQFASSTYHPEAVMRWRERWFQYWASRPGEACRKAAFAMGRELFVSRRWSVAMLSGWVRLAWACVRGMRVTLASKV